MNNFNFIESKDNSNLKLIRKLRQKKFRYKEGKFVIESRKMLEEAIQNSINIDFILLREDIAKDLSKENSFIESSNIDVKYVKDIIFNEISTMSTPDGYLAVVKFPRVNRNLNDKILLLDGIQDPGNLGTIIRSSEAFGFSNVLLLNTVDPYNDKSLRASMGSIFRISLESIKECDLAELKKQYTFYIADMHGQDYRKENYQGNTCLVIGNEANGISDLMMSYCDKKIKIPMEGKLESLNAAISASILMSEIKNKKSSLLRDAG